MKMGHKTNNTEEGVSLNQVLYKAKRTTTRLQLAPTSLSPRPYKENSLLRQAVCRPNPSQTETSSTKSSIFTRSAMRLYFPLLVCLAAALSTAAISSPLDLWTKLILTQQWPNTFCSVEHHCHPNFSYWTLHGLW
ncbi:hypothetical protein ILYODFUR_029929 [Ilyodon furcidens]|uniref:Uncharacterized protein n=1 Tax=Ilyodon furcidens TaxID=33524 RepID=A0ABV0U043_9TELE